MPDQVETAICTTLRGLFPSLEHVPQDWEAIVANARSDRSPKPVRGRSWRSRRLGFRLAAVGVVTAAVALGVMSVLPGTGPSAVERAAAALTATNDAILHVRYVGSLTTPDGSTIAWPIETWQHSSPPYDSRWVITRSVGIQRPETATAGGVRQFYDPRTNTIYTIPAQDSPAEKPSAPPGGRGLDPLAPNFSAQRLRELLTSGQAEEDGRVRSEGREAIRIVSVHPEMTLLVDAATYEPIEWRVPAGDMFGGAVTVRIQTYEWLPATAQNEALLGLSAQHPGAAVRTVPIDEAGEDGATK